MVCESQTATKQKMLVGGCILAFSIFGTVSATFASDWSDWDDWNDKSDRGGRGDRFELTDDGYVHSCVGKKGKIKLVTSSDDCKEKETYVYWNQFSVQEDVEASKVGIKNIDGNVSTYEISSKRYHVEATKAFEDSTVSLDMDIVRELCQDEDGCTVTLSMKDFYSSTQPGNVASRGPTKFFMSQTSDWWRVSDAVNVNSSRGVDGDGYHQEVMMTAWDCTLTELEYYQGSWTDDQIGFGLLNRTIQFNDPNMVCMLDIDD